MTTTLRKYGDRTGDNTIQVKVRKTTNRCKMDGPRLTEERLRNHLDSNQVMRERMCLALLPILGPYTREQPRRPKGGPDGGRDIEAIHQGQTPIWGAVGFQNGGGSDDSARDAIERKFKEDLKRAMEENRTLAGFVFFTNVDLTPGRKEGLLRHAQEKGVRIIDIFDFERLRHALDSPEGLIARLQYLEIPMSPTEQASLVSKFGTQLQQAVTARFDRVERTLAKMEQFLQFQKPILRLDFFIELRDVVTSEMLGDEAIYIRIRGLHDLTKWMSFLCVSQHDHRESVQSLVTLTHIWNEDGSREILPLRASRGQANVMISFNELSLATLGNRVKLMDLSVICIEACCTEGLRSKVVGLVVDVNGFELANFRSEGDSVVNPSNWPEKLAYPAANRTWLTLVPIKQRNLILDPPRPSSRFMPLVDS